MKIAILTQPLGHNFGGIMQAYALYTYLQRLGHEVIVIDRRKPPLSGYKYAFTILKRIIRKFTGKREAPVFFESHMADIQRHTNRFIKQHLNRSKPVYSSSSLRTLLKQEKVDCIIVGSDQVWRADYSPCIDDFFLSTLRDCPYIKLSYAASFGHGDWRFTDDETSVAKTGIASFSGVSVREREGVNLCSTYLNTAATWVCDPTLLLPSSTYLSLIADIPKSNEKFVFNYALDSNKGKAALAAMISSALSASIKTCYPKGNIANPQFADISLYTYPPVEEWLTLFRDSEIVLTDSYHGVLFSIIFEKKFLVLINKERGASRFESLLKKIDFSNNIIDFDISEDLLQHKLSQLKVLEKPSEFIDLSKVFLAQFV